MAIELTEELILQEKSKISSMSESERYNYFTKEYLNELTRHTVDYISDSYMVSGLMLAKDEDKINAANWQNYSVFLDQYTMYKTLECNLVQGKSSIDYKEDCQVKKILAKLIYLTHIYPVTIRSGLALTTNELSEMEYFGTISELFVHGGRISFSMPKGAENKQNELLEAIFGKDWEIAGIVFKRTLGDDNISVKNNLGQSLFSTSAGLEIKNNYGMNIAVGGETNNIKRDGNSGFAYMKIQPGTDEEPGCIMFGVEKTNKQLGNNSETLSKIKDIDRLEMSAFYSTKHAIGNTKGGRFVDISDKDINSLIDKLNSFEEVYDMLQRKSLSANSDENAIYSMKLNRINAYLCGSKLEEDKWINIFNLVLNENKDDSHDSIIEYMSMCGSKDAEIRVGFNLLSFEFMKLADKLDKSKRTLGLNNRDMISIRKNFDSIIKMQYSTYGINERVNRAIMLLQELMLNCNNYIAKTGDNSSNEKVKLVQSIMNECELQIHILGDLV